MAAVFGPMSRVSAAHVQSVCDTMEVPHIQTLLDFNEDREKFSLNIHPHFKSLAQAYVDFVLYYGWKKFTILYDSNEGEINISYIPLFHCHECPSRLYLDNVIPSIILLSPPRRH